MRSADWLFWRIKRALDETDIEGLLQLGCPNDEYNGEASLIEDGICKATDFGKLPLHVREAVKIIAQIWDQKFGPFDQAEKDKRRPHYEKVAAKIVEATQ